jgi:hypothetical protein
VWLPVDAAYSPAAHASQLAEAAAAANDPAAHVGHVVAASVEAEPAPQLVQLAAPVAAA